MSYANFLLKYCGEYDQDNMVLRNFLAQGVMVQHFSGTSFFKQGLLFEIMAHYKSLSSLIND